MPIEGFDPKEFATLLAKQAMEFLSTGDDGNAANVQLSEPDKKFIITTVNKFCFMSGNALANDPNIKFNAEQASLLTQFIGEWTFHKSVDLVKGKIPAQFREPILQVLAMNIFKTGQLAIIKKMPNDALINLIEDKVKKVYIEELQKLVTKGVLTKEQFDFAAGCSNMNDFVEKVNSEGNIEKKQETKNPAVINDKDKKVLKLATLSILLKRLPEKKANEILNSLSKEDVNQVINYMRMSNLEDKIDPKVIMKSLEEIKRILPVDESINVQRLLKQHYRLIKTVKPEILKKIAMHEREAVKAFITDSNFPATEYFTPHTIKSLVTSIEDKINDYKKEVHKRK